MRLIWPLILLLFTSALLAQDERFIKSLKTSEKSELDGSLAFSLIRYPTYFVDLNFDGVKEKFHWEKRDNEDWIRLFNQAGQNIFNGKLDTVGPKSQVYKIGVGHLSNKTSVLLIYFYEGVLKFLDLRSTVRIYAMAIDKELKGPFKLLKGPTIWEEAEIREAHYHQRHYDVDLIDHNSDGIKELTVTFGQNSRIFFYNGNGDWQEVK